MRTTTSSAPKKWDDRLSQTIRPRHYEIDLEIRPRKGKRYRGEVAIRIECQRPTATLELNCADLRLGRVRLEDDQGSSIPVSAELRPANERLRLRPERRLASGVYTLRIRFRGLLRGDLRGLYAASSDGHRYAFTQLEAADARRFFPCFDEPAMKACFRFSVTTDLDDQVLSNTPIASVRKDGDKKRVRFHETPLLSTYLLALAVGPLEASKPVRLGDTPIRVWHVPGKRQLAAFALEAASESLARLERYFDLPYPYEKLDLVAVPDFEAGAMENAGAVFFRETLLLLDRRSATPLEMRRAAEVICHELAHMWYGDLVTMEWWDDLWLNEAFATWMAFAIVDDWRPEWHMWSDFQHHRAAALRLDALHNTHPIHTEVRTPAEATANFDLITYEKGASVVRMIERYLGATVFRKGVRRYIRNHREGNAVASDLWNALSDAAGENVEALVRAWVERPGFPVLTIRRSEKNTLSVRQGRFRAEPGGARKAEPRGEGAWPVPFVARHGRGRAALLRTRLGRRSERVALPAKTRFVYGNADEAGFFRPRHDGALFAELLGHLKKLSPVERMGLVDHEWALCRAEQTDPARFLKLLDRLGDEQDPDVLLGLRPPLSFLLDPVAEESALAVAFQNRLIELFGPEFLELGWRRSADEDARTTERRAVLIDLLGNIAAWPSIEAAAEERFPQYLADRRSLDPHLVDAVVELAARCADEVRYAELLAASREAATPQERRRFLFSLAAVRDSNLAKKTRALCLRPAVPTQDVAFVLVRLLANPAARHDTWEFVTQRWDALARRMPPMLATRLIDATPALGPGYAKPVREFFRAHPLPAGARSLKQALERFRLDKRFTRITKKPLRAWLEG